MSKLFAHNLPGDFVSIFTDSDSPADGWNVCVEHPHDGCGWSELIRAFDKSDFAAALAFARVAARTRLLDLYLVASDCSLTKIRVNPDIILVAMDHETRAWVVTHYGDSGPREIGHYWERDLTDALQLAIQTAADCYGEAYHDLGHWVRAETALASLSVVAHA